LNVETRFFTEEWRRWRVFRRNRFVCEMGVADPGAFGMIFSTATFKLKDWYEKNPRSACEFELRLISNSLVLKRAMAAMHDLHRSTEGYDFVKKIKLKLVFQDRQTGKVEHYDFAG